jgi:hypothetical protein
VGAHPEKPLKGIACAWGSAQSHICADVCLPAALPLNPCRALALAQRQSVMTSVPPSWSAPPRVSPLTVVVKANDAVRSQMNDVKQTFENIIEFQNQIGQVRIALQALVITFKHISQYMYYTYTYHRISTHIEYIYIYTHVNPERRGSRNANPINT